MILLVCYLCGGMCPSGHSLRPSCLIHALDICISSTAEPQQPCNSSCYLLLQQLFFMLLLCFHTLLLKLLHCLLLFLQLLLPHATAAAAATCMIA